MKTNFLLGLVLCVIYASMGFAQQQGTLDIDVKKNNKKATKIDPLHPAKATFYSAVLPGLGQAFNKKGRYWKIPVIAIGMGSGIYFYDKNNKEYHRYRDAYKRRLAGFTDDEFTNQETGVQTVSDAALIDAQKFYSKNKNLSLLITGIVYILNVLEANVTAHLLHFNVDENLSFTPTIYQDQLNYKPKVGLTINYTF